VPSLLSGLFEALGAVRQPEALELAPAVLTVNEPAGRPPTHRRLDQVAGIAASDDAPVGDGE